MDEESSNTIYTFGVDTGNIQSNVYFTQDQQGNWIYSDPHQTTTTISTTSTTNNSTYITLSGTVNPLAWYAMPIEVKFGFNLKFKVSKATLNKSWEFNLDTEVISTKLKKLI